MKIKIDELKKHISEYLCILGLSKLQVQAITNNIIAAELAKKNTHGISRLTLIKQWVKEGKIEKKGKMPTYKQIENTILVNGKMNSGYYVLENAIEIALKSISTYKVLITGLTNTAPSVGYFGDYARRVANNGFLFMGFSNTDGGVVPFGGTSPIWGQNPVSIGIPYKKKSIIVDFGCGLKSWGEIKLMEQKNELIDTHGNYFDKNGTKTNNPRDVLNGGGVAAFGDNKGSALAFFIEVFAGIFTGSRAGKKVSGGWGTTFFILDPYIFIPKKQFEEKLDIFLMELKNEAKNPNLEIFYPGESSSNYYYEQLKEGLIDIDSTTYYNVFSESL